ncbi:hypothetical protein BpHYR1_040517 [Brachionus plicatilis]|uniref:Uncharacterized protein n=1 Tax=Brachionus plicatilis TaxID=10195 RepID=A0A3M7T114_BRAPC|nr:hypothetical protein BpHYR1_040517 [Brachionus plicatilis]
MLDKIEHIFLPVLIKTKIGRIYVQSLFLQFSFTLPDLNLTQKRQNVNQDIFFNCKFQIEIVDGLQLYCFASSDFVKLRFVIRSIYNVHIFIALKFKSWIKSRQIEANHQIKILTFVYFNVAYRDDAALAIREFKKIPNN